MMEIEKITQILRERYMELLFYEYPFMNNEEMVSLLMSETEYIQNRWFAYQFVIITAMGAVLKLIDNKL